MDIIQYQNQVFSMYIPSAKFHLPTKLLCFLYHCDTMTLPLAALLTLEVPSYSSVCLIVRPYCLIVRRSDQITKVHRHTSSSSSSFSHTTCPSSHIPSLLLFSFFLFVSRAPLHIDQEHAHLRTLSHLCNRWSPSQSLLPLPPLLIHIPSTKSPQHQPLNQLVVI